MTQESTKNLFREAMKSFRESRLEDAIAHLEKALVQEPGFIDGLEALGQFYFKNNRLDDAIRVTQKFCELSPDAVMAHTNLSRLYQKKGLIKEAEDELAKARLLSSKK
ncbi:MAG: tetratricopeptide repeat protein [Nitrospirae bacterium]|nr:tetratricopeptide repeat protein [Nitrospirota bacterium]